MRLRYGLPAEDGEHPSWQVCCRWRGANSYESRFVCNSGRARNTVSLGDRAGQWSIWINTQWRICFRWGQDGPRDLEIMDYHPEEAGGVVEIRNGMRRVNPGEILRDEINIEGVSEGALSRALDVPLDRVTKDFA